MQSTLRIISVSSARPQLRVRFKLQRRHVNAVTGEVQRDVAIARPVGDQRGLLPSIVVARTGSTFVASVNGGRNKVEAKKAVVAKSPEAAFEKMAKQVWA